MATIDSKKPIVAAKTLAGPSGQFYTKQGVTSPQQMMDIMGVPTGLDIDNPYYPPAPLTPLPMQAGEREAMVNKYVSAGYSADAAQARVDELFAARPKPAAGAVVPPEYIFAPTGERLSTAPLQANAVGDGTVPAAEGGAKPEMPAWAQSGATSGQGGAGSELAFQQGVAQLAERAKVSQGLQDQLMKLVRARYDRNLSTEEISTLPYAVQVAIRNRDQAAIDFNIQLLRSQQTQKSADMTTSLGYLVQGHATDVEAATARREKAQSTLKDWITTYGSNLGQAGITEEEVTAFMQTGEVSPALAQKLMNLSTLAEEEKEAEAAKQASDSRPASVKEYEYYAAQQKASGLTPMSFEAWQAQGGSEASDSRPASVKEYEYYSEQQRASGNKPLTFDEWQTADANRKAKAAGITGADDPLVATVLANPSLFNQLTATEKARISPALNALGFTAFGKPLSDTAMKEITQTETAIEQLNDLKKTVDENLQYIGPIRGLQAYNPWSKAKQVQAKIDLVKQMVGKSLEGGVLRKEDEEKYKKILATMFDTPETAQAKLNNLIETLTRDVEIYRGQEMLAGRNVGESQLGEWQTDPETGLEYRVTQ